ncbi:MAG: sigma-70 family RNA polymerase sigma factor [Opitutus sp.]
MTAGEKPSPDGPVARVFATTRWSVVLQAGGPNSDGSAAALEQLCRTYWYPLYSFARRSAIPVHDAEDLTQAFFTFLLEKDTIARANRERGRFRSFLLAAFKNFHANERAYQAAAKRGGGKAIVSLDELQPENRYRNEPLNEISPEKLYDQKWAASLLEQVMQTLRLEYVALGKGPLFDVLRSVIWDSRQEGGYEALGRQTGLSEGAFKVAVHRLRSRYKECLRNEVAQTVATPAEVDDELRHLLAAVSA